jgi:hypothetical protein
MSINKNKRNLLRSPVTQVEDSHFLDSIGHLNDVVQLRPNGSTDPPTPKDKVAEH